MSHTDRTPTADAPRANPRPSSSVLGILVREVLQFGHVPGTTQEPGEYADAFALLLGAGILYHPDKGRKPALLRVSSRSAVGSAVLERRRALAFSGAPPAGYTAEELGAYALAELEELESAR